MDDSRIPEHAHRAFDGCATVVFAMFVTWVVLGTIAYFWFWPPHW